MQLHLSSYAKLWAWALEKCRKSEHSLGFQSSNARNKVTEFSIKNSYTINYLSVDTLDKEIKLIIAMEETSFKITVIRIWRPLWAFWVYSDSNTGNKIWPFFNQKVRQLWKVFDWTVDQRIRSRNSGDARVGASREISEKTTWIFPTTTSLAQRRGST